LRGTALEGLSGSLDIALATSATVQNATANSRWLRLTPPRFFAKLLPR
jgi:hypothetical protein